MTWGLRRSAAACKAATSDCSASPLTSSRRCSAFACSDETLDQLPTPSHVGKTRVGGIDLNQPRTRAVLSATLTNPGLFSRWVHRRTVGRPGPIHLGDPSSQLRRRRAAYDLKKLRAKELVSKLPHSRRYCVPPPSAPIIA